MPIPYIYRKAARRLHPYRKIFVGLTIAGYAIWIVSLFVLDFPNIFMGIGFIFFTWPWGLYIIVLWYGDTEKPGRIGRMIKSKYPRLYKMHLRFGKIIEWPGAFMLALWYGIAIPLGISLLRAALEGN